MDKKLVKIELSFASVLMVVATLLGVALIFELRTIILMVFLAFIVASALGPVLRALQRHRIPQVISLAGTYLIVVGLLVLAGFIILPPFVTQVQTFVLNLPQFVSRAMQVVAGGTVDPAQVQYYSQRLGDMLSNGLGSLSTSVLQVSLGVLSGLLSVVTIVVISFYMIVERPKLFEAMALLLPHDDYVRLRAVFEKVETKLGLWLRGQLLLGLIVGLASGLGLTLLGVPYAVPLAVLAGIFELIPIVGPILSAIPSLIIALTISPTLALGVVILYTIVQQLEAHLVVPKVMERAVGLNPLIVIISLLIGGALMGILGALLAVPVAVVVTTILEDVRSHERTNGAGSGKR